MRVAMLLCCVVAAYAQDPRDTDPRMNLALGKPVAYLPTPNYSLTAKGESDGTDLTDGVLTQRPDLHMWFESSAVGWSYAGRVNLAVDLGAVEPIDEVAIRLLGGSPQAGIWMPGWVEVMVSDGPDRPYHKVAEYSRWNPGDAAKYAIPTAGGKAWVHRLRFTDLKTAGRMVGLRFYGTGLTCSDELYVFRADHDPNGVTFDPATLSDFTVTGAALAFHKPAVYVARDIPLPLPVGLVAPPADAEQPMTIAITFPAGVRLAGGALGGVAVDQAEAAAAADGGTTYTWSLATKGVSDKVFGRLYPVGAPPDGVAAEVRWQLTWGDHVGPEGRCPLEVVDLPEPETTPRRLMCGLSWWGLEDTRQWPDWQSAFRRLGFNTVPAFGTWLKPDDQELLDFAAQVREAGFRIQMIDSTWHRMLSRHGKDPELYCQFEDGTTGSRLCPSYRGPWYEEELARVATAVKLLRPSYVHCDIELWNWQGPIDAEKCARCRADHERSGIADWAEWRLAKGEEMWRDLYATVQQAVAESGGPPCELGVYDFRPGQTYQYFWPFDRLYPELMQTSQVSTYTPLEPYHLALVGDEVREDREKLPRSDQMPWLTPGDAGTFPGSALYAAILECFVNGSRGINFWSGRVWDADGLAGYARAIRAIAPVEDVLVDGQPMAVAVDGPGRASAIRTADTVVLLLADYDGAAGGTVKVRLGLERAMTADDLARHEELGQAPAGDVPWSVWLAGEPVRLLRLR